MSCMNFDVEKIMRKIKGRIGKKVRFKYPEGIYKGKLIDRCILYAPSEWVEVPYWDVVDLIQFETPKKFKAMRFGYYRFKNGKLKWASQTTLTEPLEIYKKLFVKAAREMKWFKEFLEEVIQELEKDS